VGNNKIKIEIVCLHPKRGQARVNQILFNVKYFIFNLFISSIPE
jgi:hypothetical protein